MTTPQGEWQYPYGSQQRYHLQHVEIFEPGPLREPVVRDYYGFGG